MKEMEEGEREKSKKVIEGEGKGERGRMTMLKEINIKRYKTKKKVE